LRSKPVLSAKVRVNKPGRHIVRLSYLAMGFDWSANYVARINPDGRSLDLTGWVTLANKQDTSFVNAPVQVIAGNIERDESTTAVAAQPEYLTSSCWPIGQWNSPALPNDFTTKVDAAMVGALPSMTRLKGMSLSRAAELEEVVMVKQRDLGDYKLYELPFKSDLPSRQIKQVMMTHSQRVSFKKIYTFTADRYSVNDALETSITPAKILLRMQNKEVRGLGRALPAGSVVVMETDSKQSLIAGINKIKDSPVGLPVDIEVGSASDVIVTPKALRIYTVNQAKLRYEQIDMEVTLVNGLVDAVDFEYRQDTQQGDLSIVRESSKHVMHKGLPTWKVTIPARSQRVIKYTLRRSG
ncbi:MAG TPA: hypothetical protein VHL14_15490, partial [Steroidobacteraceae bacterium]|nr:hypothetical protein [Steroidobacteraceae bacterium]